MIKDIRPALRAFLLADPQIAAMVGGQRIFPLRLPQGIREPSIVYARITGLGDHHMQGASGLTRPRFQIDAWAKSADDATRLADLVKARIDGYRGPMTVASETVNVQGVFFDTERENYDGTAELYRVGRDYVFWLEER